MFCVLSLWGIGQNFRIFSMEMYTRMSEILVRNTCTLMCVYPAVWVSNGNRSLFPLCKLLQCYVETIIECFRVLIESLLDIHYINIPTVLLSSHA